MSMQDYEAAREIMAQYPERLHFVGPRPESLVKAAEMKLGLRFPPTYRRFLLEYGAGSFGGSEFYGVVHKNFEESGVPDAIWFTLSERKEWALPHDLIVVYVPGNGELFCLDIGAKGDSESPVIAYDSAYPHEAQRREVIAKDFGEFLLEFVRREVNE